MEADVYDGLKYINFCMVLRHTGMERDDNPFGDDQSLINLSFV